MMPTSNVRKHTIPLGSEVSLTRQVIYTQFGESIHDVVPVANVTARAQLVTDLNAKGKGPSAANPLVVYRADAPGLHRIESTVDGSVWVPASGTLQFTDLAAATSWATSNAGALTLMDRCVAGGKEYLWGGTGWTQRIQSGTVVAPALAAGATGALPAVTFPLPFPSVPVVIVEDTGGRKVSYGGSVTATGFTRNVLNVSDAAAAAEPVRWVAFLV